MKQRKLNIKKVILTILIFVFITFFLYQKVSSTIHSYRDFYQIVKEDQNDNYLGIGQRKGNIEKGYYTTFTSIQHKQYKEYKQNNGAWKDQLYWQGTMSDNGCGITSLSIILSGYQIEKTPEDLRKTYYPVLNSQNISKELKKYGIDNSDFYFDQEHLSQRRLEEHLQNDQPILICVWNKPQENRWTNASHYMVLLATCQNKVYVSNPNGGQNDYHSSGWYNYDEIIPYLAKVLYIYG